MTGGTRGGPRPDRAQRRGRHVRRRRRTCSDLDAGRVNRGAGRPRAAATATTRRSAATWSSAGTSRRPARRSRRGLLARLAGGAGPRSPRDAARLQRGARPRSARPQRDGSRRCVADARWRWPVADPNGFLTTPRESSRRAGRSTCGSRDWREVYEPMAPGRLRGAGRALHGLRHPVLPQRLPAGQPDPGVERPGLRAATGQAPASGCTRRTTSPSSPAGCARRRARPPASSASTPTRSRSSRSRWRSSTGPGTRAGSRPQPPARLSGRTVAVVGSGPAGLAAAQQLTRAGHAVTVYERADRIGGLLRYGIPEFKMEKRAPRPAARPDARPRAPVPRRRATSASTSPADELRERYDAVVLAVGATRGRDLPTSPGRELARRPPGDGVPAAAPTGCRRATWPASPIAAARQARRDHRRRRHRRRLPRHRAPAGRRRRSPSSRSCRGRRTQRPDGQPWPTYPMVLPHLQRPRGGRRAGLRASAPQRFLGDGDGRRARARAGRGRDGRRPVRPRSPAPSASCPADLVLLAMGFTGPEPRRAARAARRRRSTRAATSARDDDFATSRRGVFVAGDAGRGQSLIVWAIAEGRACAAAVDRWLTGATNLPAPDPADRPAADGLSPASARSD